jgi:hypothetical protein
MKEQTMRQLFFLGALVLAGCRTVTGPVEHYRDKSRPDRLSPTEQAALGQQRLTIPEQEQRGRDQLAQPDYHWWVAPRTYADFPGPHGR